SGDEWERINILDGIPSVCSTTSEQFIPQALNLDLIDGVSFNKGCYPGQEIVARVHFLGKTKQRMRLAYISVGTSLAPGDPVYRKGHELRAATIVDAVCNEAGCNALISINSNDNEKYYADTSPDALVEWRDLPYAVVT
ncbi:MAG: folate-binding protein, partial [Gammaproteobacteria bacterium]|nr:folate-binding protein [Gammaproteobacteria bacterium]